MIRKAASATPVANQREVFVHICSAAPMPIRHAFENPGIAGRGMELRRVKCRESYPTPAAKYERGTSMPYQADSDRATIALNKTTKAWGLSIYRLCLSREKLYCPLDSSPYPESFYDQRFS
jgi:hypothetical protein